MKYRLIYYQQNASFPTVKEFDSLEEIRLLIKENICEECLKKGDSIARMRMSPCARYNFSIYDSIHDEETSLEALERFLNGDHKKYPRKNDGECGNYPFFYEREISY